MPLIASVGIGTSSVPYGNNEGYASGTGVNGTSGPAASSLRAPTSWYVRTGGSNNNGGSSNTTAAERSGTDGVGNGTTTFTSATAAFTQADVGKGICVNTGANARRCRIVSVTNATTIICDVAAAGGASGLSWAIGGAWADPRASWGDSAISGNNNSPVRTGDTVYIGAGTYRMQSTMGNTWTGYTPFNAFVFFEGDVTGFYTGDAGMVYFNGNTVSDKTTTGATPVSFNGKSNFSLKNIYFTAPSSNLALPTGYNWQFIRCAFTVGGNGQGRSIVYSTPTTQANFLVDQCFFMTTYGAATGNAVQITLPAQGYNDWDCNVTIRNTRCLGQGGPYILVAQTAGTGLGGGVRIIACSFIGGTPITGGSTSTTIKCYLLNSLLYCGSNQGLTTSNNTWFQDYNVFVANTATSGTVAGGTHSQNGTYNPMFHFGQEWIWGALPRPIGEPMANSPLLGFGSGGFETTVDAMNRPRPAGGSSALQAAGALERGNSFAADASPIGAGGSAIKITGPGYADFLVPLPASRAVTISCKVKWDASYLGTKPQITILANPSIGISAQTVTATGSATVIQTLTCAAITATAAGNMVRVRVSSTDLSGASVIQWDDFSIT